MTPPGQRQVGLQKTLAGSGLSLRLGKAYLMHSANSSFPGQPVSAGGGGGGQRYEVEKRDTYLLRERVVEEEGEKAAFWNWTEPLSLKVE